MLSFNHKFKMNISKKDKETMQFAFDGMKKERASKEVGYYDLPLNSTKLLKEIESYKVENELFKNGNIKDIVVIGIGGSSLGTKAIYEPLKESGDDKKNLHFLENVDPIDIKRTLSKIEKDRAVFIVISKSGSTIETTSIFKYVLDRYKLSLENTEDMKRIIAITDEGSALSKFADEYSIKQFNLPSNVGGRFSVLSAVGIVPLSLAGIDVKELLEGAKDFVDSFFNKKRNDILKKALFYTKNAKKYPINVLFSYSTLFEYLNQWYVQLWAESLGKIDKDGKNVGLTPIHLVGSVDQHSFLQLIIQGPRNKTVTVLKIENFNTKSKIPNISLKYIEKVDYINEHKFSTLLNEECNATFETMIDEKLPVDSIVLGKISPFNIGTLITYYELLTSAAGQMLNINTYDQPGVEFGKIKLVEKFKK